MLHFVRRPNDHRKRQRSHNRKRAWKDRMRRRRGSNRLRTTPLISAKLLAISSATIALARLLFIATLKAMPCEDKRQTSSGCHHFGAVFNYIALLHWRLCCPSRAELPVLWNRKQES